jgi:hypothetical protein
LEKKLGSANQNPQIKKSANHKKLARQNANLPSVTNLSNFLSLHICGFATRRTYLRTFAEQPFIEVKEEKMVIG